MKRCFVLLIVLSFAMLGNAQENHLRFLNLPLCGDKASYVNKLEVKGFEVVQDQKLSVMMVGKYEGEDVTLLVGYTPVTGQVYCVSVMYWPLTSNTFESLTLKLKKKYGDEFREISANTDSVSLRRNTEKMNVWKVSGLESGFVTLSKERNYDNPYTIVFLDGINRNLYYEESRK